MRTKIFTAAAALVLLTMTMSACAKKAEEPAKGSAAGGAITWTGYTDGMKESSETGKPVIVDFYTTWCKYCVKLDETTYKDPEVIRLMNENFISIKVNAEGTAKVVHEGKTMTESELAAAYKVEGFPTIWFIDGKGVRIAPLPGYTAPEEFKPVLTYISGGAYARGIKYPDYVKSLGRPDDTGAKGAK